MGDQVEVIYQPFLNRGIHHPGAQRKTFVLPSLALSGFILMAYQVTQPGQIKIIRQGQSLNLFQSDPHRLAWGSRIGETRDWFNFIRTNFRVEPSQIKFPFIAILANRFQPGQDLLIQAESYEFFQGAIFLCKLLGLSWNSYIVEIHKGQEPHEITSDHYLASFELSGTGSVPLSSLSQTLDPQLLSSLTRSLDECFGISVKTTLLPTTVFITTSDPEYRNVISSAMATSSLSSLPRKYQVKGSYFIFNVCTSAAQRGKGLGKTVLIALINDLITKGATAIQLEVDPLNSFAYCLYVSLGFAKVAELRPEAYLLRFKTEVKIQPQAELKTMKLPPLPKTLAELQSSTKMYHQPSFEPAKAKVRSSERVSHLLKLLPTDTPISVYLDLGAGNAEITAEVAKSYSVGTSYAIDVYPEREFKQPTSTSRIIYQQRKDNRINLPDASVDLITAFMFIHHVEDFETLLKEIYRVLKPGGWFFIREHDLSKVTVDLDEIHRKFGHGQTGPTHYWTRPELDRFIISHGFRHISDSDYTTRNPQGIYHTLYQKI